MNSPADVKRAWEYVTNFNIPTLSIEGRDKWRQLIERLSVEEFQRACRESRGRNVEALKFRPSIEEFFAYAKRGKSATRLPAHLPRDTTHVASLETNQEQLAICRALLKKESA